MPPLEVQLWKRGWWFVFTWVLFYRGAVEPSGTAITTGAWHFLVGTYNGTQVCMSVDESLPGSCVTSTIAIGINPGHAYIDMRANGSRKTALTINQVRVYNCGMTSTQVSTAYAAGH
jgi:hypothetical protein